MELGEITVADVVLLLASIVLGGGFIWFFVNRVTKNKNTLKNNRAKGDIAGGNIVKSTNKEKEITHNKNILKGNKADGDIAGGNIYKDK